MFSRTNSLLANRRALEHAEWDEPSPKKKRQDANLLNEVRAFLAVQEGKRTDKDRKSSGGSPWKEVCPKCGRKGHKESDCWKDKICGKCNKGIITTHDPPRYAAIAALLHVSSKKTIQRERVGSAHCHGVEVDGAIRSVGNFLPRDTTIGSFLYTKVAPSRPCIMLLIPTSRVGKPSMPTNSISFTSKPALCAAA